MVKYSILLITISFDFTRSDFTLTLNKTFDSSLSIIDRQPRVQTSIASPIVANYFDLIESPELAVFINCLYCCFLQFKFLLHSY